MRFIKIINGIVTEIAEADEYNEFLELNGFVAVDDTQAGQLSTEQQDEIEKYNF